MTKEYLALDRVVEQDRYLEAMRQAVNAIQSCNLAVAEYEHYMSRFRREMEGESPAMKRVLCLEWLDWAKRGLRSSQLLKPRCQTARLDAVNLP